MDDNMNKYKTGIQRVFTDNVTIANKPSIYIIISAIGNLDIIYIIPQEISREIAEMHEIQYGNILFDS